MSPLEEGSADHVGGGAPAGDTVHNGNGHASAPQDALRDGLARLAELREYAAYFISAQLDQVKAAGIKIVLYAVAGVLGLVMGAAFVGTAAVLLLLGIAHGLGELFHHAWIGEVVVAGVILAGLAGGLIFALKWLPSITRKQLVSKYEARQRKQRSEFGRDVAQQARAARDRANVN
jgi:hypothetical protein